jgi:peptidoglycan hydrolase-like protein with peptidoglycan-binding domain
MRGREVMNERRAQVGTRGNLVYEVHTLLQSWPLVKRGSSGHPVPALQYLLRAHGHQVTVDGIFGAHTAASVRGFQRAVLLTPDGIVGSMTGRALVSGMLSF